MAGAFDGLCVLELTWGIAGPMTGMMLADQGANVTRIEPPHDPFARQPGSRVLEPRQAERRARPL